MFGFYFFFPSALKVTVKGFLEDAFARVMGYSGIRTALYSHFQKKMYKVSFLAYFYFPSDFDWQMDIIPGKKLFSLSTVPSYRVISHVEIVKCTLMSEKPG